MSKRKKERRRKNPHLVNFLFSSRCSMSVHFLLFSVHVPSSNSDSLVSVLMSFISHLIFIFFLISNVCLANISKDFKPKKYSFERHQQCRSVGEVCYQNYQCCSPLSCSMLQGKFDVLPLDTIVDGSSVGKSRCLPSLTDLESKRQSEDLIIPPYYNHFQQQPIKENDMASALGKKQGTSL